MKVLLIDVNYKNSSTGQLVYDLYTGLVDKGHSAAVCYGRGDSNDATEPRVFKFGVDLETNIHALLARITGLNGYFSYFSTKRLINFIKEYKPDVIHIHELHAYFVNHGQLIRYIKKAGIPVLWTFHCEYMYTGKCGYAYECERYKKECGKCPYVKDYPKSLFFDFTKKMLHDKKLELEGLDFTIAVPSKWSSERVRDTFLSDRKIVIIHNGIHEEYFYPNEDGVQETREQLGIATDAKVVLSVAPNIMEPRKGGAYVLQMAKRFAGTKTVFVMVGVEQKDVLVREDNVIKLAPVKDKEYMAKFYNLADVFLLCSSRETFSMTCAESISCGTPVVGFECGAPETVFKEDEARFVKYGDTDALESAIREMLDSGMRIADTGRYSKERMVNRYIEEYENLISD